MTETRVVDVGAIGSAHSLPPSEIASVSELVGDVPCSRLELGRNVGSIPLCTREIAEEANFS